MYKNVHILYIVTPLEWQTEYPIMVNKCGLSFLPQINNILSFFYNNNDSTEAINITNRPHIEKGDLPLYTQAGWGKVA